MKPSFRFDFLRLSISTCASVCLGAWLLSASALASSLTLSDSILLQTFKSHSRLSFRLDEGSKAIWKDVPGGFELTFPGLTIADLGVPLGSEKAWTDAQKKRIKDARLSSISFKESERGLQVIGKWNYPKGDQAPAHPVMEHFDYRQKMTNQFVIDFWVKAGPTVAEMRALNIKKERELAKKTAETAAKKREQRRIASLNARVEAEDVAHFCKEPISDENDFFLNFYPVREKLDLTK